MVQNLSVALIHSLDQKHIDHRDDKIELCIHKIHDLCIYHAYYYLILGAQKNNNLENLGINLEEAETLAATAKDGMTKSDSKKGYIENQLKFDRETARIAAAKMWKNSAGGAPVFGS